MASLVQSIRNSGARFFDNSRMDNDDELLDPVLESQSQNRTKKLKTIPLFTFHLLVSTAISIFGVVLAATWKDKNRCEAYFIMLYLRAAFWILTVLFDHLIRHHHLKLRMNGYHEFHRSISLHKKIPLYIVSLWNCVLLALASLMHQYYGDNFGEKCIEGLLSPIVYVTLFSGVETLIFMVVHISYIVRVLRFNRSHEVPDALQGSLYVGGSVGLTQRGAEVAELLEKQADLINYLKDHNLKLNQKLMQLNAEVRQRQNLR